MSRPVTIDYQKVTLSLPRHVVEILERVAKKGDKSRFVAEAIETKAEKTRAETDVHAMFEEIRKNCKILPGKSAVELLREDRYENH